ncbi:hypothetical protein [Streptomyces scabiei]|uniref:hypothetical protein n=1 Tax=Streptomyces scabiei TaxID=1930 RepID=UPI0037A4A27E
MNLANVAVVLQWTPGGAEYTLTLLNEQDGTSLTGSEFHGTAAEALGYDPTETEFDMCVFQGLAIHTPLPAKFARALAGFAFFDWVSPAAMTNKAREKFGAHK